MEAGSLGLKILRHTRLSRVAALLHPSAHPVPTTQERPRETADSAVGCRTLFQVVVKQAGKSTYLCVFVNAFI